MAQGRAGRQGKDTLIVEPIQAAVLKKGADAAIESARGFLLKLVGPAIEEAGLLLQDQVRVYRFRNQIRILARAERMIAEADCKLKEVPLKVLVPLLEHASLEDEVDLQDKWAALIANAACGKNIQPLFGDMLGRLSGVEARLLEGLFEKVHRLIEQCSGAEGGVLGHVHKLDLGNWADLIDVYVIYALNRPELSRLDWNKRYVDPEYRDVYREFGITLDKFLREAILWRKQISVLDGVTKNHYVMTVVGYEFIAACHQPTAMGPAGPPNCR